MQMCAPSVRSEELVTHKFHMWLNTVHALVLEYLGKIMQLSVGLPQPREKERRQLVLEAGMPPKAGGRPDRDYTLSSASEGEVLLEAASPSRGVTIIEGDSLLGFENSERSAFGDASKYLTSNPRKLKRVANSYRFFRTMCRMPSMGAARLLLAGLVTQHDIDENTPMRPDNIWASKVLKLFIMAEQWPYRTALLSEFAEAVDLEQQVAGGLMLCRATLQSVYISRPRELYVANNLDLSHTLFRIRRVDMPEDVMLSFLQQAPFVTVRNLHLLSRYLFNLSNAVRQGVRKGLTALSEQRWGDRVNPNANVNQNPPSVIDQWLSNLHADTVDDLPKVKATNSPACGDSS
eukprot:SAG31_NODE_528_length_14438_cov_2.252877_2_plen_348_part_00